jgi:hypothetical protein
MANQRLRPVNQQLRTSLLFGPCQLPVAISRARSLCDVVRAVIVAFLNHKGGVGKTTLALHVAGAWAAQGKRVVVVDTDSQGSALDWSEQRAKEGLTRLFDVLALARDTLHVEAPEIARDVHHVVIDGSSRITALTCREMYHLSSAFSRFQVRPCAAPAQPLRSMASRWAWHASATNADACFPFGRVAIPWPATRCSS